MLAETRATIQSMLTAIRKPTGWIAPSRWIGSRSQLVKSTWNSTSLIIRLWLTFCAPSQTDYHRNGSALGTREDGARDVLERPLGVLSRQATRDGTQVCAPLIPINARRKGARKTPGVPDLPAIHPVPPEWAARAYVDKAGYVEKYRRS